jgi:CubicO group peptidase (beta-lactamase class C family)
VRGRDPELRSVLDKLTAREVPGISAAVVRSGQVGEIECAGEADIAGHTPATPGSVYLWFSMTKIVTATAVMQLAERELLDLDDPVERFLPEFPSPRVGWPRVRVRHLLSHSAGLANPIPIRWVHPAGEPGRDPHRFAIELLRKHSRLRFPAGTKALYSNLGYVALFVGQMIGTAEESARITQHGDAPFC